MIIRPGEKRDIPAAHSLIQELAEYEKAPNEVTTTVASMEEDGFGERPFYEFFVAESEGEIVGIAVYFYSYSTWKGRAMYLEDLVVRESKRRLGIGKLLFDALVKKAKEIGAKRLSWQVLDWNTPAIEFYKKINAEMDPTWVNCRFSETGLVNYE